MTASAELLELGALAPACALLDHEEQALNIEQLRGGWVVLYFYPRDNTSGCTMEALEFTALLPEFEERGASVLGVSPDSVASHKRFVAKHDLGVRLLADAEREVLKRYGAWGLKRRYGRESWGVVRSTVLIDPEGRVQHVWRNVRARGHAAKVLAELDRARAKRP